MAAELTKPYEAISRRKCAHRDSAIPPAWRLPPSSLPSPTTYDLTSIPSTCGVLSAAELSITEDYDATSLAAAIASRKFKVLDVTIAYCKRAAVAQQLVNCITEPLFSAALHRAAWLDQHIDAQSQPLPPLYGVPISVKDQFDIAGIDSSMGIANMCFKPASSTAPLVQMLTHLGAVVICKTNMPQTGMALDSVNNVFGRTLNPHDTRLTAGGSSGGEAALVAMRGSALGVGTDIGGSIRIPAACCGLYGFKPSAGRLPYSGVTSGAAQPGGASIAVEASAGPIARSLRDVELFMRSVLDARPATYDAGVIPGRWDSTDASLSGQSSRASLRAFGPPAARPKLTIGVLRGDGLVAPLPPVAAALAETARKLAAAGHAVVELATPPGLKRAQSLANALFGVEGGGEMFEQLAAQGEPLIPWLARAGVKAKPPKSFLQIRDMHAQRLALAAEMREALWKAPAAAAAAAGLEAREVDAFICPVAAHPTPALDSWGGVGYTASWVLLDYVAGTVPVGSVGEREVAMELDEGPALGRWDEANRRLWSASGRRAYVGSSLSVQVVAPRLQELRCHRAMEAVDEACNGVEGRGRAGKTVLGDVLGGMAGAKL